MSGGSSEQSREEYEHAVALLLLEDAREAFLQKHGRAPADTTAAVLALTVQVWRVLERVEQRLGELGALLSSKP